LGIEFLAELDKVWQHCLRALVPGGRLICVVGDVCLSRRKNDGRHTVVPLHASIQEHCRKLGFDNLAPIIWHKIANAVYEVENGSPGFLGKPYEPNAVIKNDIEFILMERKPGGYRTPSIAARVLSVISAENHQQWFQQIWTGVTGASTKHHPAPYPLELAERLVDVQLRGRHRPRPLPRHGHHRRRRLPLGPKQHRHRDRSPLLGPRPKTPPRGGRQALR
jgi:DNA modification methylase